MTAATTRKIKNAKPPFPFEAYTHVISQLPQEDGGGFLITFPDLPGCMSDGTTEAETVVNGKDAGKEIPAPFYRPDAVPEVSGKFVTRLPKSVREAGRARQGRGCQFEYTGVGVCGRGAGAEGGVAIIANPIP